MKLSHSDKLVERRWWMVAMICTGLWMMTGCGVDSSLGEVTCDNDDDCPSEAVCDGGYCIFGDAQEECAEDKTVCSGECVDVSSDRDHCGGCGIACGAEESCEAGECISDGEGECDNEADTWCSGQCVDLHRDVNHCGGCGQACPEVPADMQGSSYVECHEGYCHFGCDGANIELCNLGEGVDGEVDFEEAVCVDVMDSIEHCGSCGNACVPAEFGEVQCIEGSCEVACDDAEDIEECDGTCVNVFDDEEHCGECGNRCSEQESCHQGQCMELPECSEDERPFGGGSGESGDPYTICAPEHLRNIEAEGEWTASFALVANIDFSDEDPVETIGRGDYTGNWPYGEWVGRFEGSFRGYGFAIEALTVEGGGENRTGLFGFLTNTASVTDLRLHSPTVKGEEQVGAVAGRNQGEIEGVTVTGADIDGTQVVGAVVGRNQGVVASSVIEDAVVVGQEQVGGVVGRNEVVVESSMVEDTAVTGEGRVGGAVGRNEGTVMEVEVVGTESVIVGTSRVGGAVGADVGGLQQVWVDGVEVEASGEAAGGLVGASLSDVEGCHASAQVSGHDDVGGLVGRTGGDVVESSAQGSVSATGDRVGGLVGRLRAVQQMYGGYEQASVYRSYADVEVDATQSDEVGGLVGRSEGDVFDSYALGTVIGDEFVGGLVGFMWREEVTTGPALSDVYRSYAWGETTGNTAVGGLVGERLDVGGFYMPEVHDSYWNVTVSVEQSDGGEPLDETGFINSQNFSSWEFGDVWEMGSERPMLEWE